MRLKIKRKGVTQEFEHLEIKPSLFYTPVEFSVSGQNYDQIRRRIDHRINTLAASDRIDHVETTITRIVYNSASYDWEAFVKANLAVKA